MIQFLVIDLAIIAIIGYAMYVGSKRGFVLIGLELVSFILATLVAMLLYVPLGTWLKPLLNITYSLSYIAAFILIWVTVEVIAATTIRITILPRLHRALQLSLPNRVGGGFLNAIKSLLVLSVILMIVASIPIDTSIKRFITTAQIPKLVLASTSQWQSHIDSTLGRDIGNTITFFTVPSEIESDKNIELGFTTTSVKVDAESEARMLILVNHERTSRGLKPLSLNEKAREVARVYSTRMLAEGFFSHIDPDKQSPFDRMKAGGVKFVAAGENLAIAPTLDLAHQGLMNSPGHRDNILNPEYRQVGIGVIDAGIYGLMITQDFTD